MKGLIWFLPSGLFLISCENTIENAGSLQADFKTHILDGYFVTSITFDNLGNAWIGTFKPFAKLRLRSS